MPREYKSNKALDNRFIRRSLEGVFNKLLTAPVEKHGTTERLMIDATHPNVHHRTESLLKKGVLSVISEAKKKG